MKFSLMIGFCPPDHYLPLAEAADRAGWDAVCVPDGLFWYEHTATPYPYSADGSRFWSPDTPFLDPFVIISMMAAVTRNLHFYTNVLKLPVREPLLVAKAVTSIAVMTADRFGLGVGLSPWLEDFTVLRQDWHTRGPRSAEMVDIIRGISRGEMWHHDGKYYRYPPMQMAPVPNRPVPIFFGGLVDAIYRRAARMGDGYIGWISPKCDMAKLAEVIGQITVYLQDYGRDPAKFEFKAQPARSDLEVVEEFAAMGVTDFICMPWMFYPGDFFDLEHRVDSVERFAAEIIQPRRTGD